MTLVFNIRNIIEIHAFADLETPFGEQNMLWCLTVLDQYQMMFGKVFFSHFHINSFVSVFVSHIPTKGKMIFTHGILVNA